MADRADTFNRADGTLHGSTPSGGGSTWVCSPTDAYNISSNIAQSFSTNTNKPAYLECSEADGDVQVTYLSSSGNPAILARYTDDSNFLFAYIIANFFKIYKRDAGSNTELGSYTLAGATANDAFKLTLSGTSVKLFQNGTERVSVTTSFNQTATKHGIYSDSAGGGAQFDGFSFTTSGADVTPPTISASATNAAGTTIACTLSESGCTNNAGGSSGSGGFTLSGTAATVSSWAISGTTLTLTLSGTVANGETVTLTYARASTTDDIKDAAGNFLADFSSAAVTNNVPPALDGAVQVLLIGDSIYDNTPTSGQTIGTHLEKLLRTLRGHTITATVVDHGVSGSVSADWDAGSTNLTDAISASESEFGQADRSTNPVYAFVRLYANDAVTAVATATYATQIDSLFDTLIADGFFVVAHGPTFGRGSYGGAVNTRQLAYLAEVDLLVNGTTILEGERVLYAHVEADAALVQDDVHPSAVGSEVYAGAEADRLAEILYPAASGTGGVSRARLVNAGGV